MCGIIGCVGRKEDTLDVLLNGLSTLEYRGYDSAGLSTVEGDTLSVTKKQGELDALENVLHRSGHEGSVGIGHTRWSTHGPPSDANAHPHTDESGRVAVVHNGIIENYQRLRDELVEEGVTFTSDTDSEVVPHLVAKYLTDTDTAEMAFKRAIARLEGSYALACIVAGEDAIFAARSDSPLVLGIGDGAYYLASDIPAFLEHTRDVVYLEDGEFVTLRDDGWCVTTTDGQVVDKTVETVEWNAEQTGKSGYEHFMLKEINEQPTSLRQCISGRVDELNRTIALEELDDIGTPDAVQFVACGTSYHAAVYGALLLREAGIPSTAHLASEYATANPPLTDETLVVGITQSGETADTLSALRDARSYGAETLAVTNVVGSTAARECNHTLYIRAGPEIGVAATKTFSSQLVSVNFLVEHLTDRSSEEQFISSLRNLPGQIQEILDSSDVEEVVEKYLDSDSFFFIGRGANYPVALEGALKFKEITYEHAEGFAAGELKHGPLSLVTESTPVFAIVTGDDECAHKTISNIKEVEARGAPVVVVTDGKTDVERYADHVLEIPETHDRLAPILANIQLQLTAYHTAAHFGRSIDKPRNLAKSVTVE